MSSIRVGITMRMTVATGYYEPRDTIAQDWARYMISQHSQYNWLFVPNIAEGAIDYFKNWNLNALIITGGDDFGIFPERDQTELALLEYGLISNIPIIGVCRGMQLIHRYFNGKLHPGSQSFIDKHRATTHSVTFADGRIRETNSYHNNVIDEQSLDSRFQVLARYTDDNSIEAIQTNGILGMMWHPERDEHYRTWNTELIQDFLN